MGNKSSAYLDHGRHGGGKTGSETVPSGTIPEKSGGSTRLRKRGGGSRGGGIYHGSLKEEQFSGIATIQLTSVLAPVFSEFWD